MAQIRESWLSKSGLHKRITDTDNQYRISQLQQQIISPVEINPIIESYARRDLLKAHTQRITTASQDKQIAPAAISLASSAARWQSVNLEAQVKAYTYDSNANPLTSPPPSLRASGRVSGTALVGPSENDKKVLKTTQGSHAANGPTIPHNLKFNTSRFHMQNPYEDAYNAKAAEYVVNSGMRTWEKNRKAFVKSMEDSIRSRREIQVNTLGPSPPIVTTSVKSHFQTLEEGKKSTQIVSGVPGTLDTSSLHARSSKDHHDALRNLPVGSRSTFGRTRNDTELTKGPGYREKTNTGVSSEATYYRTYTTIPDIDDGDLDEIQSHPIEFKLGKKITHPLIFKQAQSQPEPVLSASQGRARSAFTTCWEENLKTLQDAYPVRATTALEKTRYRDLARRNIHTSHGARDHRIVNPPNAPKDLVAGPSGDILLTALKKHQLRRKAILGIDASSDSSDTSDSELDTPLPILPFRETPMNVLAIAPKLKSATIEDAKLETERINQLPKAPFSRRVQSSTLRRALVPRENWDSKWVSDPLPTDENKKSSGVAITEAPKKTIAVMESRPYSAAATLYSRGEHPLLVQARLATLRGHLQAEVGKRKKAHLAALKKGAPKKR